MGKGEGYPSCGYPQCQFDPQANMACAKVCRAFGSCIGPCEDPCYILSALFPACRQGDGPDFTVT